MSYHRDLKKIVYKLLIKERDQSDLEWKVVSRYKYAKLAIKKGYQLQAENPHLMFMVYGPYGRTLVKSDGWDGWNGVFPAWEYIDRETNEVKNK